MLLRVLLYSNGIYVMELISRLSAALASCLLPWSRSELLQQRRVVTRDGGAAAAGAAHGGGGLVVKGRGKRQRR
jgi:hypothetical protein